MIPRPCRPLLLASARAEDAQHGQAAADDGDHQLRGRQENRQLVRAGLLVGGEVLGLVGQSVDTDGRRQRTESEYRQQSALLLRVQLQSPHGADGDGDHRDVAEDVHNRRDDEQLRLVDAYAAPRFMASKALQAQHEDVHGRVYHVEDDGAESYPPKDALRRSGWEEGSQVQQENRETCKAKGAAYGNLRTQKTLVIQVIQVRAIHETVTG